MKMKCTRDEPGYYTDMLDEIAKLRKMKNIKIELPTTDWDLIISCLEFADKQLCDVTTTRLLEIADKIKETVNHEH